MDIFNELSLEKIFIQKIEDEQLNKCRLKLDILRLDKIHPVVSGNKWYKLKYYINEFAEGNYNSITTFGGPFSNHIIATAYACFVQKIKCTGYIRGEEPKVYSDTLSDAKALNMQLVFLSRNEYGKRKRHPQNDVSTFFIPEGGFGETGARGASEILNIIPGIPAYDYIISAVGTGTMMAGIANASFRHQKIIGISVFKNNYNLVNEVFSLTGNDSEKRINIFHDYHFGGYAKYNQLLLEFMNKAWVQYFVPLDFVYTAKTFYAIFDLLQKKYFIPGSKILFIHSGGLQGNRSLEKGTLLF